MRVFFYGLFMDEQLLAAKGVKPSEIRSGFVEGYALRIGERATLVRSVDNRAYGLVMDIAPDEAKRLYAEESVADYAPEPIMVRLMDGPEIEARCYNLPDHKITGTNTEYAQALLRLAMGLGFPDSYLDQIRQAQIAR